MKSLKELLLENGLKETQISNHESDLYCKKCKEADIAISAYESVLGQNVCKSTFVDNVTNEIWYEIPFGYMPEHYTNKCNTNKDSYYLVETNFNSGKDGKQHIKGEKLNFDGNAVTNSDGEVVFYANSENYMKYGVEVYKGKEIR